MGGCVPILKTAVAKMACFMVVGVLLIQSMKSKRGKRYIGIMLGHSEV